MISVEQALTHLFELAPRMGTECVPLDQANGRVLVRDVTAQRDQPPFAASAMDGYAVQSGDVCAARQLTVIGESAAGHRYHGVVQQGQAVRIFTGAPVPLGADFVVIQEDVTRDGDVITLGDAMGSSSNIRAQGADFDANLVVTAPRRLGPKDLALLAAMNVATVEVSLKPTVAIISTGDELVYPGQSPNDDQIIASNPFGLAAMVADIGGTARILPIAADRMDVLLTAFDLAAGADVIVTIGGASVGDHDLVAKALQEYGASQSFYKVAMRPGKPLMAGKLGSAGMVGLPGNPVSSMVCGKIFLEPMLRYMMGFDAGPLPRMTAPLAHDVPENGPREHYMRAQLDNGQITLADRQDSALLSVLGSANALVVRPPHAPAIRAGQFVEYISF
jgi:molybdopterin molybdotransferase